ncbi:MAG: hypothetical protein F6K41_17445 [Symploca sp. SIO3E6]|nr:hypothetical protein [Caldora sp. SIO3E6]
MKVPLSASPRPRVPASLSSQEAGVIPDEKGSTPGYESKFFRSCPFSIFHSQFSILNSQFSTLMMAQSRSRSRIDLVYTKFSRGRG